MNFNSKARVEKHLGCPLDWRIRVYVVGGQVEYLCPNLPVTFGKSTTISLKNAVTVQSGCGAPTSYALEAGPIVFGGMVSWYAKRLT